MPQGAASGHAQFVFVNDCPTMSQTMCPRSKWLVSWKTGLFIYLCMKNIFPQLWLFLCTDIHVNYLLHITNA